MRYIPQDPFGIHRRGCRRVIVRCHAFEPEGHLAKEELVIYDLQLDFMTCSREENDLCTYLTISPNPLPQPNNTQHPFPTSIIRQTITPSVYSQDASDANEGTDERDEFIM